MRKYLIGPAVALAASSLAIFLFVFFSRPSPPEQVTVKESRPEHPTDLAPPPPSQAPPIHPELANVHPTKLSEVELTATLKTSLQQLGPYSFELLDYRLGFLSRLTPCLANRIGSRGWVDLDFVFEIPHVDGKLASQGTGSYVSFIGSKELPGGSQLNPGDTAVVLECAKQAHFNYKISFRRPAREPQFHWRPSFFFPIDDNDLAYKLARTGTWK